MLHHFIEIFMSRLHIFCLCFLFSSDNNQWIQVNFQVPKLLTGIITEGSPDEERWVEKYEIYTSIDGKNFQPYTLYSSEKTPAVFLGNKDRNTPVRNLFNRQIIATTIRLVPVKSSAVGTGLRFDVLGCEPDRPPQRIPTPAPTTGSGNAPTPGPTSSSGGVPTPSPSAGPSGEPTLPPVIRKCVICLHSV